MRVSAELDGASYHETTSVSDTSGNDADGGLARRLNGHMVSCRGLRITSTTSSLRWRGAASMSMGGAGVGAAGEAPMGAGGLMNRQPMPGAMTTSRGGCAASCRSNRQRPHKSCNVSQLIACQTLVLSKMFSHRTRKANDVMHPH